MCSLPTTLRSAETACVRWSSSTIVSGPDGADQSSPRYGLPRVLDEIDEHIDRFRGHRNDLAVAPFEPAMSRVGPKVAEFVELS